MTTKAEEARGPVLVIGSAVIAGALGFVLTFVVARTIGAAAAAGFTAFWSFTYFLVGSLAGVQQEVTRAARPASNDRADATPLRRFALAAAGAVLLATAAIGAALVVPVFGAENGWWLLLPLAIGPAGYVVVAVVGGALYGLHRWTSIAVLVVTDSLLRLIAVSVTLLFTHDLVALGWAIALPFPAALAVAWAYVRRGLVGRIAVDVPVPQVGTNAAKAVAGSLATAVLVSGFSLLVVATSPEVPADALGAFVFAVTVVRAPVMVGVMSIQSLLIVRFRDQRQPLRRALPIIGIVLAGGIVLIVLAFLIGDSVLAFLVGPDFAIGPWRLVVVVASSVLMGVLFVTGPLAIAMSRHVLFASGWVAAAIVSVGSLLLPIPFDARTAFALLLGPAIGVAIHLIGFGILPKRQSGPVVA